MRKPFRIIAITVYLVFNAATLFAEWQQQNPRIAGGPLSARYQTRMTSVGNGRVLLLGGRNTTTINNDTWVFDINLNRWTKISPTILGGTMDGIYSHGMAYLGWESVLVYGGSYNDYYGDDHTWILDFACCSLALKNLIMADNQ